MNDSLGDRMKSQYEDRTRYMLPRRTYTIVRIDGRAFHTYTRDCVRPFDRGLMLALIAAATETLADTQGARFAYQQSDEVSFLLTDFESITTQAVFDGNLQKIISVMASTFTAHFNAVSPYGLATFDARAFTIPDRTEVENYFIWRQKDATKNSIQMVARHHYSHKQLHGLHQPEMQELIFAKSDNWNDYPDEFKRGAWVLRDAPSWDAPPIFTQERAMLTAQIPVIP